jgi:ATP-dependent protease HslVU (ClpYQ) peptidase subunit
MKLLFTTLISVFAMSFSQAGPPSSPDEALAAFRVIWKSTLAEKLASSTHIVQLRHQVYQEGRVAARQLQSAECHKLVSSTLSADEKKRLVIYGTLDDLNPDRKVWAITNPGEDGNGFEAYLDQKTGKLLFLWIIPEG